MSDTQISLDDLFDRIRSDKRSSFADGASLSTIRQVQKDLKILFPDSLVKFWQQFNGGEFGFGRICSVKSIGAEIAEAYSYNKALKKLGWVPFGDTYGGDLLCFAKLAKQANSIKCEVIEWDHEAQGDIYDDGEDDDHDGDDFYERDVAEDAYLNRYPDFRDLIADYYYKAPRELDADAQAALPKAWQAKAPQDKKIASDILEIPGAMRKPTIENPTVTGKPAATDKQSTDQNVAKTSQKLEKEALAQFVCPHCSESSLQLLWKLELLPGDDWDEEQVQLYKCGGCGFHGIGWYEESRRGSLNSEVFQHRGFPVSSLYWKSLAHWFTGCPSPDNKQCHCYSHKWLKEQGRFPELSQHAKWFDLKR